MVHQAVMLIADWRCVTPAEPTGDSSEAEASGAKASATDKSQPSEDPSCSVDGDPMLWEPQVAFSPRTPVILVIVLIFVDLFEPSRLLTATQFKLEHVEGII